MANFKGFKQVSLSSYNGLTDEEKKNYLWLVRDLSGETVLSSAIYFGTRKYAEVNDSTEVEDKVDRLIAGLASIVDENGDFVGFLNDGHELLSSAETLTELFEILEAKVLENEAAIDEKADLSYVDEELSKKADADEVQEKLDELEEKLEIASEAIESGITEDIKEVKGDIEAIQSDIADANAAIETKADKEDVAEVSAKVEALETIASAITTELDEKANAEDVYTKAEVDAKVVGLFHFVDTAEAISSDFTTITYNGEDIVASSDNAGDVYQIGDKEYASNGEKWVELGFNVDLSAYATKEDVNEAVSELESGLTTTQEALAREIEIRESLAEEVETVKGNSTTTATTFADAEELDLQLGQIVYVTTETTDPDNSGVTYFAGAYIQTQDGLKKLDSTTPSSDATVEDRVDALENRAGAIEDAVEELNDIVGNAEFDGESLSAAIAELQADKHSDITGDDVEV